MAVTDEFLRDWRAPHTLAFGAGAAIAIGALWQFQPAAVIQALTGTIGWVVLGGAVLTVMLSERYGGTVRREPGYFVAGIGMGLVLAAKLFS